MNNGHDAKSNQDVTAGKEPTPIDKFAVKAIIADYRRLIIQALHKELRELNAQPTDADIVIGRRRALLDAITIVEEIPYNKNWVQGAMTAIRELSDD